ncbi:hypothetical protein Tco_0519354, partial [Tanacetum coccineum]
MSLLLLIRYRKGLRMMYYAKELDEGEDYRGLCLVYGLK